MFRLIIDIILNMYTIPPRLELWWNMIMIIAFITIIISLSNVAVWFRKYFLLSLYGHFQTSCEILQEVIIITSIMINYKLSLFSYIMHFLLKSCGRSLDPFLYFNWHNTMYLIASMSFSGIHWNSELSTIWKTACYEIKKMGYDNLW